MTFISTTHVRPCPSAPRRVSLVNLLSLYRQRRALAKLDATRLADIGLTAKEADAEARRPFWDVPQHWVK